MSARVWLRLFRLLISSVTKRRTKIEVAIALHKIACQAWEDAELWHRGSGRINSAVLEGVADSELTKKRADASTAKHLHALRPEYAKLGFGVDRADGKAQQRIDELKAKIKDCY